MKRRVTTDCRLWIMPVNFHNQVSISTHSHTHTLTHTHTHTHIKAGMKSDKNGKLHAKLNI